jgi:hypothetical protein
MLVLIGAPFSPLFIPPVTCQVDKPSVIRDPEWRFSVLEFLVTDFQMEALLSAAPGSGASSKDEVT